MKCTTVTNCESEPTLTVEFQGNLTKSTSLSIDQVENTGPTVVVSGTGTNGIQTGIGVVQFYGCDNVEGLCLGLQGQYVDDCSDNLFGFSSVVSQTTIGVGSPNWDGKGEVFLFEGYEFELIENREDFAGEDCGEQIGRSIAIASTDDGLTFVAAGGNGYVRVWNKNGNVYGEITPYGTSRNLKRERLLLQCSENCAAPTSSAPTITPPPTEIYQCESFFDQFFTAILNIYAPFFPNLISRMFF
eukprot:CAMPEP_0178979898 /NCGR_PEP_ID=MMETSP0789-20121207/26156_1 /TAXON_ID=3005 /ORGANISM="Rhizosolenia setigera, Strain CCMP 1694" /LENGTH=243 /DNA_ID=CAMNT_0020670171 /DNA_START=264 /DNA_END=992 /DNA_ORIENTATION=+